MNIILPIVNYQKMKAKEKEAGIGESLKKLEMLAPEIKQTLALWSKWLSE